MSVGVLIRFAGAVWAGAGSSGEFRFVPYGGSFLRRSEARAERNLTEVGEEES